MLNIGGTNLTQISFSNITGEIKFIDSLKYYQKSLALFEFEKKKEKKLDIVSEGKGVISYELIIDMESFFLTPENEFSEKTEFLVN